MAITNNKKNIRTFTFTVIVVSLVYIGFFREIGTKTSSIAAFNIVLLYLAAGKAKSSVFGRSLVAITILLLGGLIYAFEY